MNRYPGLVPELGVLLDKLKQNVQFPDVRRQSNLLPLLSPATTYYIAVPNYGEPARQALTTFREELKQSQVLREWWQSGDVAKTGTEIEDFIDKFAALSQYLGGEIVVAGETGRKNNSPVMVAEIRKPGLNIYLQQMLKDLPEKSKPNVRVLELKELATAKSGAKATDFVVLVRPDFLVAGGDLETVRKFNGLLEARNGTLASTPFGQRLSQAYQSGTSVLAAGDLHRILDAFRPEVHESEQVLAWSGFGDVKYLVWDHNQMNDQGLSETELSFMGPRHGAAAWLAAPAPMGSLDFVSPKAEIALTVMLKDPRVILDDLMELSALTNSHAFAALPQMEQALHVSLKEDLLDQLQGEISVEMMGLSQLQPGGPPPLWDAILRVNDSLRLQKTLDMLLQSAPVQTRQSEEDGVRYYSVVIPSPQKATEIGYAFVDGYLILGSNRETVAEAVGFHKSGGSLGRSRKFLASLPPGHGTEASALLYEDAAAMIGARFRQLSPDAAATFSNLNLQTIPVTFCAYGEESALRSVSVSGGADAGAILIVAAIAIPNLLRARGAANESSAVATLRMVNVSQITYSAMYPRRGYARDLATLGPDPRDVSAYVPEHAGLIDETLGNANCTSGAWCAKSGYSFTLSAMCKLRACKEYVVVGTPIASGTRNFCSTSDGVIRFQVGPILTLPISAAECMKWPPLK
jgi:type II secretory pathway pseudopilin PulG